MRFPVTTIALATFLFQLLNLKAESVPTLNSIVNGNTVSLSWATTNAGFGLEYTDHLTSTNWAQVRANVTNGVCLINDAIGQTRFYRLVKPWGTNLPPTLPGHDNLQMEHDPAVPKKYFQLNDVDIAAEPVLFSPEPLTFETTLVVLNGNRLSASQIIDPASPTNGSLSFHWEISNEVFPLPVGVAPPRIIGYNTPELKIQPDALPNGDFYFDLSVTSNVSQLTSRFTVIVSIRGSALETPLALTCFGCGCTTGECAVTAFIPGWIW